MSITGRIEELSHRHRELDSKIESETKRPAKDDILIAQMKRQKLRIKEELAHLQDRPA